MARKRTGSKRWPPNIGVNNGNVRYRRQIPKDLTSIAGKRVYQEYLTTLTPESSFEDAFEAARPVTLRYDWQVATAIGSMRWSPGGSWGCWCVSFCYLFSTTKMSRVSFRN